jgi:hypothetical protein
MGVEDSVVLPSQDTLSVARNGDAKNESAGNIAQCPELAKFADTAIMHNNGVAAEPETENENVSPMEKDVQGVSVPEADGSVVGVTAEYRWRQSFKQAVNGWILLSRLRASIGLGSPLTRRSEAYEELTWSCV